MVRNSLRSGGSSSQANYISRYPAPAAVIRSQVPTNHIAGLLLPFYPFLRAVALLHIRDIRCFCHCLAPHRNRHGHPWSPLWLRLHQQCLGLLTNLVQKPKVPWRFFPRRSDCAHSGPGCLQMPMFHPLNKLWLEYDKT